MKLTEEQSTEITRYLRDVARELRGLTQDHRRDALQRANDHITEEIAQIKDRAPDHDDLKRILQACGSPESFARHLKKNYPEAAPASTSPSSSPEQDAPTPEPTPRVTHVRQPWALDAENGKLLGVCAGIGAQFELDARFVRFLFVVLLVTGPLILLSYVGLYVFMRTRTHPDAAAPIDWGRIVQMGVIYFGVLLLVHMLCGLAITWIVRAYEHPLVNGSYASLGFQWTWIVEERPGLLFWMVLIVMPLAILSALPVHKAWSKTLAKIAQCSIALYSAYLTYGIAALLTGIGLSKAGDFQGIDITRLLSDYLY